MKIKELIRELEKIEDQDLEVEILDEWEDAVFPIDSIREEDTGIKKILCLVF